jgi:hypothetical protein
MLQPGNKIWGKFLRQAKHFTKDSELPHKPGFRQDELT